MNPLTVERDVGYFPNGRVNVRTIGLSPVTGPEMHGPDSELLFQTGAYPDRDDGPQWSWEQGIGRSPGQQWPHMPHREQYSDHSIAEVAIDREAALDLPADSGGNPLVSRFERHGWALAGPAGGEFYHYSFGPEQHQWPVDGGVPIEVAPTVPYTALAEVPA